MLGHSPGINFMDRVIGFFSPKKAYERIAYRHAYTATCIAAVMIGRRWTATLNA